MPDSTRTFVAIALPDAVGQRLTKLQSQLAPDLPGVRWTATPPFHVTLAFLGDVEDADLNAVCRGVADASAGFAPLDLRVEGVGAFPDPARPRILWAGLTGPGLEPLAAHQKAVLKAVAAAGYRVSDTRFHPHVTLGRVRPGRGPAPNLSPIVNRYKTWSAGAFTVVEAITFASTLSPDGPIYAPLGRAPLAGRKLESGA
ncbi:MAG: RNA 2',3'-cyclic phosphodiesterase [Planctomycetaceae bacterium]|nr:RNA 2',3'-cyclic phosphodiesterase [Planctomycetaceae bacterium]